MTDTSDTKARRIRGSTTGRPIMVALDLLGRRGTLRVLWELRERRLSFSALQAESETNASLLRSRLAELRTVGLVTHTEAGFQLSAEGQALLLSLMPFYRWAESQSEPLGRLME